MSKPTAIVTGANQGIGAVIAQKLAFEGYHVILLARNEAKLVAMTTFIREKGGDCSYYTCDVADALSVNNTLAAIEKTHGQLPLTMVNNAGIGGPFHKAHEVSEAEWDMVFDTNIKSAFLFCRQLLPAMKAQGFGRIVNIASVYGQLGGVGSSTYCATKHALIGYTKALAVEWGGFGITANSISPGFIATEMNQITAFNEAYYKAVFSQIPSGQMGQPQDIADMVAFLAKPSTNYMNGENIVIDGGLTAGFDFK